MVADEGPAGEREVVAESPLCLNRGQVQVWYATTYFALDLRLVLG